MAKKNGKTGEETVTPETFGGDVEEMNEENADQEVTQLQDFVPDLGALKRAGWEEESLDLYPYWNPSDADGRKETIAYLEQCKAGRGKGFHGTPIGIDDTGDFVRWVIRADSPLVCQRGSEKDGTAVKVQVKKGELFTMSKYAGLPLERFMGTSVIVQVSGQRKTNQPQDMWTFNCVVSPEAKKELEARRKETVDTLMKEYREKKRLARASAGTSFPHGANISAPQLES